jgi:uncharacterized protein (DUF1330 family)
LTVYALAQLTIHDRALYGRYQSRFMEVLRRHKGRLLAADENPRVEEGTWEREKVVLLAFADQAAYRAFADSPDYSEIARDRKAGADAVVLLVRGIDAPPA